MKKLIPYLIIGVFAVTSLFYSQNSVIAGNTEVLNLIGYGMSPELAGQLDKQYSSAVTSSEIPAVNNAINLGSATKAFQTIYTNGIVNFGGSASNIYVPTPVATPVAGTNIVNYGLNIIPTAAANTAVFLPLVVTPGAAVRVFNSNAANAVRVKAQGTPGINGSAAGLYVSIPALGYVEFIGQSATNWAEYVSAVAPTPAGP